MDWFIQQTSTACLPLPITLLDIGDTKKNADMVFNHGNIGGGIRHIHNTFGMILACIYLKIASA